MEILAILMLLSSQSPAACPTVASGGEIVISSAQDAIRVAQPVLRSAFGERRVAAHAPYQAKRDGRLWRVYGQLPLNTRGGTPEAVVCSTNGEVISVFHTQ